MPNKSWKCKMCCKYFNRPYALNRHMQSVHSKDKPFTCTICNKSFGRKDHLNDHVENHGKERTHHCVACSKAFKDKKALQKHMLIHEKIKPYTCSICKKGIVSKNRLSYHMKLHQEGYPYKCTICDELFTLKRNLDEHIKIHAKKKVKYFNCGLCDINYDTEKALESHLDNHCNDETEGESQSHDVGCRKRKRRRQCLVCKSNGISNQSSDLKASMDNHGDDREEALDLMIKTEPEVFVKAEYVDSNSMPAEDEKPVPTCVSSEINLKLPTLKNCPEDQCPTSNTEMSPKTTYPSPKRSNHKCIILWTAAEESMNPWC